MTSRKFNISLALGFNERYDHQIAIGIIKFARTRPDWSLVGNEWLLRSTRGHRAVRRPDGIIARITNHKSLRALMAHGVPIVDIANSYEHAGLPVVSNDDHLTGQMAGRHFVGKGFRHFAYVGTEEATWSKMRHEGLCRAVRDFQEEEPAVFNVGLSWLYRMFGLDGLARWLARLPRPCAVMAVNDLVGYRITMAARIAGLCIPDDIAVMGVDNEEVYCELSQPRLTSIACDCERIGMEAANLLAQLLDMSDPLRWMAIPPLGIDDKESTGIIIGQDPLIRAVKNFIRANVGRGINVADVASAFPVSRRTLEKRFRDAEDKTVHDELIGVRLDKARSLLRAGKSVNESCYASGFASVQYFYHSFKTRYGVTPAQFAEAEPR